MTMALGSTSMTRCLTYGVSSAPAGHHGQRRHVSDAFLDRGDQRPRHRVADHRHGHYLLPLDRADHVVGIEMVDDGGEYDGLAGGDRRHHAPLCRAVNQRRQEQQLGSGAAGQPLHDLVDRAAGLSGHDVAAAERRHEDVVLPPQHAFRHPGGTAGVEDVQIVGECCSAGSGESEPMMVS